MNGGVFGTNDDMSVSVCTTAAAEGKAKSPRLGIIFNGGATF